MGAVVMKTLDSRVLVPGTRARPRVTVLGTGTLYWVMVLVLGVVLGCQPVQAYTGGYSWFTSRPPTRSPYTNSYISPHYTTPGDMANMAHMVRENRETGEAAFYMAVVALGLVVMLVIFLIVWLWWPWSRRRGPGKWSHRMFLTVMRRKVRLMPVYMMIIILYWDRWRVYLMWILEGRTDTVIQ